MINRKQYLVDFYVKKGVFKPLIIETIWKFIHFHVSRQLPIVKLLSAPFKEMVQTPHAIFLQSFEKNIEVTIGCCEYSNPGLDKTKHSVDEPVQVVR